MKITEERLRKALQKYVFETVIPSVGGAGTQWLLGAGYALMEDRVGALLKDAGLFGEDGTVELDALDRAVAHGFKASGGKASFSLFGHKLTFIQEDWNNFKRSLASP